MANDVTDIGVGQDEAELENDYYIIHYDNTSGYDVMEDQYCEPGVETDLQANTLTKPGYSFMGWDTSPDGTTVRYTDGQSVTDLAEAGEEITLYAVWRRAWGWLIRDGDGKYYTMSREEIEGEISYELVEITVTELTAEVFYTLGFQFQPPSENLITLDSPTLLKWDYENEPSLQAELAGIPLVPQLAVFETMTLSAAVKYINIAADNDSLWDVSFDGGENWFKYSGGWVRVTQDGDGCLKRNLEILTSSEWAEKVNGTLKFRVWLLAGSWVKRIRVDY